MARLGVLVLVLLLGGAAVTGAAPSITPAAPPQVVLLAKDNEGLAKIDHLIMVVMENRSFDHYFGMYPGANGIPRDEHGVPTVCAPDPRTGACVKPYHETDYLTYGGPHAHADVLADINGGRMDGFIRQAIPVSRNPTDVMSYYLRTEIPAYWAYADAFVLFDNFFQSNTGASRPAHNYIVSGWSAQCGETIGSCRPAHGAGDVDPGYEVKGVINDCDNFDPPCSPPDFKWTDLTYLLNRAGVSWRYYVEPRTPHLWNPLPEFQTVHDAGQTRNVLDIGQLYRDAAAGALPQVAWVKPRGENSEHPPWTPDRGQNFVVQVLNAIGRSPDWGHSAVLLLWDDWGGYYDHVQPPTVDNWGYSLRVPALMISPYARAGVVDRSALSFDAFLKLVEDRFLGGQRLDATSGRPDPRPTVRENVPILQDLRSAFDFDQPPRPPLLLDPIPLTAGAVLDTPGLEIRDNGADDDERITFDLYESATGANVTARLELAPQDATAVADSTATLAQRSRDLARSSNRRALGGWTGDTVTGAAPLRVQFDPTQTTDPGATARTWRLDFGDGTVPAAGTGRPTAQVQHKYSRAGTFTAVLQVDYDTGEILTDSVRIQVAKTDPPLANLVAYPVATPRNGAAFDASASAPDVAPIASWSVDFGDGTPAATGTGRPPRPTAVHAYATRGTYTATVTVRDSKGRVDTAPATVTVLPPGPPTACCLRKQSATSNSLLMYGDVNPSFRPTTFWYEYGRSPSLGSSTTRLSAGQSEMPISVPQTLRNLTPGAKYYVRLVAQNDLGTVATQIVQVTLPGG